MSAAAAAAAATTSAASLDLSTSLDKMMMMRTTGSPNVDERDAIMDLLSLVAASGEILKSFAEKIPLFAELTRDDQQLLLCSAALELLSLRLAYQ